MKSFLHRIVIKKMESLRVCTLILLCALALGLMNPPSAVVPVCADLTGLTVAVDPGHGGYDGGARAHDSRRWEKDINLEIALLLADELEGRGAKAVLTRTEDVDLAGGNTAGKTRKRADLQRRLDIAKEAGADVFLSIHLNEYRDRSQSGPQVFYQRGGDAGRLLAGALQEALIAGLSPQKERKAMAGDYYVLRGELPSALVECGFLSNAQEEKLLLSPAYQRRIAKAVADGLARWCELVSSWPGKDL